MRKSLLGVFQTLILFFSQALTLQILFYPLVLMNLLRYLPKVLNNNKLVFGFLLIFIAAISIYIRGASISYMIILLRFYCGIILVYGAFVCNKNLQVTRAAFWIFILFVLYEFISLSLGLTPFTYVNFTNAGIANEVEGRISLANTSVRPFGPAMNSSVSGSILAIAFYYVLLGRGQFLQFKNNNLPLLIGLFFSFVFCGSGTAMAVFLCLSIIYFIRSLKTPNKILSFFYLPRFLSIFIVLAFLSISLGLFFSDFLTGVLITKWNAESFIVGLNYKLFQLTIFDSYSTILFGSDLSGLKAESAGGDFVFLSFVYHFGLIYVLIFVLYLLYICKPENRIFLFIGFISTFHYGTTFTLMGQVFFGALIAGSVLSKEFLQHSVNLSQSYTKKT